MNDWIKINILLVCMTLHTYALDNEIMKGVPYVEIEAYGTIYKIGLDQNSDSKLNNTYARTSRPSPPFFIQPFHVAPGVETYGELEVLEFLNQKKGIFIDARLANSPNKENIVFAKKGIFSEKDINNDLGLSFNQLLTQLNT